MVHEQRFSAFFYGTLLHPKILKRVIDNDGSHLEICPAVLLVSFLTRISWGEGEKDLTAVHHLGSYEAQGHGEEAPWLCLLLLNADPVQVVCRLSWDPSVLQEQINARSRLGA